ncbi:hypothetical protein FRC08_006336 [Ceratobasidium sp. 394]|nr:hypothetical protein FRC08_006336 [Ceratobasidium sp. 394]
MFVLQECSICFEDFDNERNPHSIPCGHVFCRPCLESLASTPSCPNCRTSYTPDSIRKVVCTHQDQNESSTSGPTESEAETLMWQAIKSAVETPNEYEQRKSLVTHNSSDSVREAGMSANLIVALEVLRMLVKTEQRNHSLKDKVDTARAVEESLCDRISILEAQLSAKTGETSASSHDLQLLLAQVRALQSSVQLIKTDTSTIVRHLNTEPPTPVQPLSALQPVSPIQARNLPQPSTPITSDAAPDQIRRASTTGRPFILRKPSSQTSNNSPPTPSLRAGPSPNVDQPPQYVREPAQSQSPQQECFLPHARTPSMMGSRSGQLMSPPVTPAAQANRSLFAQNSPMPRWGATGQVDGALPSLPDQQGPRSPIPGNSILFPVPQIPSSSTKLTPTPTQPSSSNPFRSPKSPSFAVSPPKPAPTPTPTATRPRTITTTYAFSGTSPTELSFTQGQTLHLFPDSDLSPGKDWVWCRTEEGAVGYAPRSYLRVE